MLTSLPLDLLIFICRYDSDIGRTLHLTIKKLYLHTKNIKKEEWYKTIHQDYSCILINSNPKLHSFNDQSIEIRNRIPNYICDREIYYYGKYWFKYGKIYRDNDKPAIIYFNGGQMWYHNDQLHRNSDQPAIIHSNGNQVWYLNGQCHRDNDQPAIIYSNGDKLWYKNDQRYEITSNN